MNSSKTKLLFITYTHSNGGGAEHVLTTFVNSLPEDKYSITIQEIYHFDVKKEPLSSGIKFNTPLHHTKKFNKPFNLFNYYLLTYHPSILKSVFNWNNYDCIITWNYQVPSFALNAFKKEKKIGWFHGAIDDLIIDENSSYDIKQKHDKQFEVWSKADKLVTISNKSKESLKEALPELINKCSIISNPVSIDEILDKSNADTDVKIPHTGHNLISIGRLDSNKNNALAINALPYVLKKFPDTMLYLIGTGYEKQNLEKLIIEKKITNNVVFLGYQQNPYPILKQCDVLCMTSFSEGFGMVVAEAMALNKTFVTTPVAGASDELALNNTCGLVSDWDPEKYASKIIEIFSDKKLYKSLCKNAFDNIQNYSIEATIKKFEALINSIQNANTIKEKQTCGKLIYSILFALNFGNFYNIHNRIIFSCNRIKSNKSIKNIIKFFYHIFTYCLNIITVPVLFIPKLLYCIIFIFKINKDPY